jgi:hypothetical protein
MDEGNKLNEKVDVWAFGVILWEVFEDKLAWPGFKDEKVRERERERSSTIALPFIFISLFLSIFV